MTDNEIDYLYRNGMKGVYHIAMWAAYFGLLLDRKVTEDEARAALDSFHQRWRHDHPAEAAEEDRRNAEFLAQLHQMPAIL